MFLITTNSLNYLQILLLNDSVWLLPTLLPELTLTYSTGLWKVPHMCMQFLFCSLLLFLSQPTPFALLTPDYPMSRLSMTLSPKLAPEMFPIASTTSFTSPAEELTPFYCYNLFTFLNPTREEPYYEAWT